MSKHHLPKVLRLPVQQAIDAVGGNESLWDVLDILQKEGAIRSWETVLEVKVDRDKAIAIENYFLLRSYNEASPIKKNKKNDNDY